jgi:hypothetical protein
MPAGSFDVEMDSANIALREASKDENVMAVAGAPPDPPCPRVRAGPGRPSCASFPGENALLQL